METVVGDKSTISRSGKEGSDGYKLKHELPVYASHTINKKKTVTPEKIMIASPNQMAFEHPLFASNMRTVTKT